jgi:hypothetical protein
VTEVVVANPENVLTPALFALHATVDAKMRITFEAASPTPESCNEHVSVNVQSVAAVCGPEIWNDPI